MGYLKLNQSRITTTIAIIGMLAAIIGWAYSAGSKADDIQENKRQIELLKIEINEIKPQVIESNAKLDLLLDYFDIASPKSN